MTTPNTFNEHCHDNRSSIELKGSPTTTESFEMIMQRRLMKFLIESINKQIIIRYKNSQMATGVLHALDTDKLTLIVKNYYGYDEKKEYKKLMFGDIDYFKVKIDKSEEDPEKVKESEENK